MSADEFGMDIVEEEEEVSEEGELRKELRKELMGRGKGVEE